MAAKLQKKMEGFISHTEEGVTRGALPLNKTTEFWVAVLFTKLAVRSSIQRKTRLNLLLRMGNVVLPLWGEYFRE